jgi:hypothetical protein
MDIYDEAAKEFENIMFENLSKQTVAVQRQTCCALERGLKSLRNRLRRNTEERLQQLVRFPKSPQDMALKHNPDCELGG